VVPSPPRFPGSQLKATKHCTISEITEKARTNPASGTTQGSRGAGRIRAMSFSLVCTGAAPDETVDTGAAVSGGFSREGIIIRAGPFFSCGILYFL
jgi:hypothetical protein